MRIKKGDKVIVITGKDKGKIGEVIKAMPKDQRVIVEGVNVQTKHQKQTRTSGSEIRHQEGPIHVSNVMIYDEKAKTGTRVAYKLDGDKKVRVAKKSGNIVD